MVWRPFRPRAARHVVLYGKPGCHLCEDARNLLAHLSARYSMVLEEVDITDNAHLYRLYDIRIPVIVVDGKLELSAPIHERDLVNALRAR